MSAGAVRGVADKASALRRSGRTGGAIGVLSPSQVISVVLVPTSVVMLIRLARRGKGRQPAAAARKRVG